MLFINAEGAFATLLNLMAVPGVLLICYGAWCWHSGWKLDITNRARQGRMLLMFGFIILTIVLILSFFIAEYKVMRDATRKSPETSQSIMPVHSNENSIDF